MTTNYNDTKDNKNKSIIIPSKNTDPIYYNLNLHNYQNYHHYLQNIAKKWKDKRLDCIEIPKGLIEVLQNADYTIEKILDSCPADIAEKLGIDSYIGEIIFKETKKAISKINSDILLINK
jgi:hypothetical protein